MPYVFVYFISLHFISENRSYKAFWSVLSLAVISVLYQDTVSILFAILFACGACWIYNHFNKYLSCISVIVIAVMLGLIIFGIQDYINNFLMLLAEKISRFSNASATIYGGINSLFNTITVQSFEDLFAYRSYGGTAVIDNNLVTGIKDLFDNGYDGKWLSAYLSGHFYQLFVLAGICLSLADEIKGAQRTTLIIVFVCAIVSGDFRFALLFMLLESQFLSIAFIIISALCYLVSNILDLRAGYFVDGGIIELILNLSKPIYLLVGGIVFTAIGFFVSKYVCLRFGITDSFNVYIPSGLNSFVDSLGGIVNIVKIREDNIVEVRNPKLINTFKINCDIKENLVKVDDERLCDLEEYLE
ncbi:MAG: hypothetical protein NC397_02620 [Clostridium sp.]|nr:hypothetical protein [Clostridium sp.]